ncbi:MAG: rhomboid family intramembrane serine protease [bacterium]|nr:rhomboid family intramembrane serine protease [bacterium]
MIPLKDENPTEITPFVTGILIAANVLVWLFVQGAGGGDRFLAALCSYGAIPAAISGAVEPGQAVDLGGAWCRIGPTAWFTLLSSMFLHGGWMHLIGNLWFLWVFGNNIEDSMGHGRFVVFYLLTGVVGGVAHLLTAPASAVPVVGASGAISGVMGAYIVLYPRVRVLTLIIFIFFVRIIALPAVFLLGLWFAFQILGGAASKATGGGVAFWAHVGGFVAGVALIKLFERPKLVRAKREHRVLGEDELGRWERW